jgi:hypothetical protein
MGASAETGIVKVEKRAAGMLARGELGHGRGWRRWFEDQAHAAINGPTLADLLQHLLPLRDPNLHLIGCKRAGDRNLRWFGQIRFRNHR